jgi:peptidoglycan hydrolase-like protein with peptidoglycan-binding domain
MPSMLPTPTPWLTPSAEGFSSLKQGASGPEVEYLQRQLQAAGFFEGAAEGYFDAKTKAAVMAFQRARGLEVDGIAGPRTWSALDTRRGSGLRPVLKRGMCEPAVVVLQKVLTTRGFAPGAIDGIFDPRTERAVLAFQRAQGLEADGIVGPKTWAALKVSESGSFPAVTGQVEALVPTARPDGAWTYSL